ncbi:uncharacterized protein N7496_012709 [Penicillium cataractarum]|uniref:Uncharacterized protein n=1 Tax=Penicillium cataractarum TaxID=2100454 RepID=A0A9W9USA6_9EURO|nr:uncharacterized protein N7496_012709 [Penicillium cataractarum]KAJ5355497.1 hypothetical protein N7496_012709 [Penicillium cataractarum]
MRELGWRPEQLWNMQKHLSFGEPKLLSRKMCESQHRSEELWIVHVYCVAHWRHRLVVITSVRTSILIQTTVENVASTAPEHALPRNAIVQLRIHSVLRLETAARPVICLQAFTDEY